MQKLPNAVEDKEEKHLRSKFSFIVVKEEEYGLNDSSSLKVDRTLFDDAEIIGQVKKSNYLIININEQAWNKLIVCRCKKKDILFIVDQHAVHERIRYEYYQDKFKDFPIFKKFNEPNKSSYRSKHFNLKIAEHKIRDFSDYSKYILNFKGFEDSDSLNITEINKDEVMNLVYIHLIESANFI